VRVNWEHLVEAPVNGVFNSHLRKNFSSIPGEVGDMEFEWIKFKASIIEAAARSCGQKAVSGGNLRTCWWTPVVKERVRLKEAFRLGWPKDLLKPQVGRQGRGFSGHRSKNPGVGGVREAMEKDFRLASRKFWQIVWSLTHNFGRGLWGSQEALEWQGARCG